MSPEWTRPVPGTRRPNAADHGDVVLEHGDSECGAMYDRFADLLDQRRSDVDAAPLRPMSDVFLLDVLENGLAFAWQAG